MRAAEWGWRQVENAVTALVSNGLFIGLLTLVPFSVGRLALFLKARPAPRRRLCSPVCAAPAGASHLPAACQRPARAAARGAKLPRVCDKPHARGASHLPPACPTAAGAAAAARLL